MKSKLVSITKDLDIFVALHDDGSSSFQIVSNDISFRLPIALCDLEHIGYSLIEMCKTIVRDKPKEKLC